jgi:hypothetical protein
MAKESSVGLYLQDDAHRLISRCQQGFVVILLTNEFTEFVLLNGFF